MEQLDLIPGREPAKVFQALQCREKKRLLERSNQGGGEVGICKWEESEDEEQEEGGK